MLLRGLIIAVVIAVLDQLTKWAIVGGIFGLPFFDDRLFADVPFPAPMVTVTPFFDIVLHFNAGISFGLLPNTGPWLLAALALAIVVGLVVWLARTRDPLIGIAVGAVIGGAIGNAIDRVRLGAVVDFLHFHAAGWSFPSFNLADSAISLGVVALLADSLFSGRGSPR